MLQSFLHHVDDEPSSSRPETTLDLHVVLQPAQIVVKVGEHEWFSVGSVELIHVLVEIPLVEEVRSELASHELLKLLLKLVPNLLLLRVVRIAVV